MSDEILQTKKRRRRYKKETKPRKPGGGRKPLENQDLRTVGLAVSVTRAQKKQIKSAALAEGLSISEYVHKHFLSKQV